MLNFLQFLYFFIWINDFYWRKIIIIIKLRFKSLNQSNPFFATIKSYKIEIVLFDIGN